MDEEKRGFDTDDIRDSCLLWQPVMARHAFDDPDIDAETVNNYQYFFDSILVGLSTPHMDIALYRRCLHLILTTDEFAHFDYSYGDFQCVLSFIYEGGFISLLQLVRGLLSGLFHDQALLADLAKVLQFIFRIDCCTLVIFYIAHQSMSGGNMLLLLTDCPGRMQILQNKQCHNLARPTLEAVRVFLLHYNHDCHNQREEVVIKLIRAAMIDIFSAWTETATTYLESDPDLYPLKETQEEKLNKYLNKEEGILAKAKA